jgi:hypothetical protein
MSRPLCVYVKRFFQEGKSVNSEERTGRFYQSDESRDAAETEMDRCYTLPRDSSLLMTLLPLPEGIRTQSAWIKARTSG